MPDILSLNIEGEAQDHSLEKKGSSMNTGNQARTLDLNSTRNPQISVFTETTIITKASPQLIDHNLILNTAKYNI